MIRDVPVGLARHMTYDIKISARPPGRKWLPLALMSRRTNKRYSQKREMAQHVTGSIADLHAEHQLAPAEQTGNRESSGGGGVCTCVCGWVVCGRRVDKVLAGMPKMKEINGLISLR
ncbi:uncharacterized [Tachysurus ichikawai]